MTELKKMYINFMILIFALPISVYTTEIAPAVSKLKKSGNHIKFNHCHELYVRESEISNDNKSSCGTCTPEGSSFPELSGNQKCLGSLENCSVFKFSANYSDCQNTCKCNCYSNNVDSIKSFCLDPISVNISENYAITGVRFKAVNGMIMLQVDQVQLDSSKIISYDDDWVETITCDKTARIDPDNSRFVFDKITLKENHVLTSVAIRKCQENWQYEGLSIKTVRNCDGDFFFLTAYGTSLDEIKKGVAKDYTEGMRSGPMSISHEKRNDVSNENMGLPEMSSRNMKKKRGNHYVKFRLVKSEISSIIPYLASTQARAKPFELYKSIELAYYGDEHHGGFIYPILDVF